MLKSGKIFQPKFVSPLLGGFVPNSSLSSFNNSGSNNTLSAINNNYSTSTKHLSANQPLPDPSKAILKNKLFHYSTISVAACLPISLLFPTSGLTYASDVILSVVIPSHFYFGMRAVINDYIYTKFLRFLSNGTALVVSGVICVGIIGIANKEGLGTLVHQLWRK